MLSSENVVCLPGRYDDTRRLREMGCTARLSTQAAKDLAPLLTPAPDHRPWLETFPPDWAAGRERLF
ncbi:hypothetical protein GCM10022419_046630 [Nonomuraea rosea]|uniref:Uncharacterized protein n=1 Tax=Nonomuraea rosea TaxID=638574 RepID=A0ABP6X4A9_9ACTN